ncbi:MAG: bifunctional glutamate N-acetyltransferase/amino-acid acetyltransferase ArgJ [Eubacteriales bacterium]|nr:bifunctional glutamate N-acetyltransferase/amino-acid acetyltransferase ArgJ [Eubacteriales bacterium]
MKIIDGSITSPSGYRASGVACGLKKNGNRDLAMIVSTTEASAAGIFTKNVVKGHSLQRTMSVIRQGYAQAVIINSGNANACVGPQGLADADKMAHLLAKRVGCADSQIITGSTGVIGQPLNMEAVTNGIEIAWNKLSSEIEAGHEAELAIMTTDLVPKEAAVELEINGQRAVVAGMAKGSGMIHPNMATMIGIITTDLKVDPKLLRALLKTAADRSFNRVSVDGDTSVCDMVIALANGASGIPEISSAEDELAALLLEAMETICVKLAKMIAADGEGATKLIEVNCRGARTAEDAHQVVLAVGKSPLVKTAMFGEDANWGRILTAAGYSGVDFDPDKCNIWLGDLMVCQNGCALPFDEDEASRILNHKEITINIELGEGEASDRLWTCDFSYDYVKINGSYRT